jgi:cold shock protein
MASGVVKKWMEARGFGFIQPDGGDSDVFFHFSELPRGSTPHEGDRVTYDMKENARTGKPQAANVRIVQS